MVSWNVKSCANDRVAGIFTQDKQARGAIVELLDLCRDRTGWPTRSLGIELQHIWERHGSPKGSPVR
jgi:hypothetical protein